MSCFPSDLNAPKGVDHAGSPRMHIKWSPLKLSKKIIPIMTLILLLWKYKNIVMLPTNKAVAVCSVWHVWQEHFRDEMLHRHAHSHCHFTQRAGLRESCLDHVSRPSEHVVDVRLWYRLSSGPKSGRTNTNMMQKPILTHSRAMFTSIVCIFYAFYCYVHHHLIPTKWCKIIKCWNINVR